jgi:hypothetical protein
MQAPSDGNPLPREVIIMFEPHRLEHHLMQSAYALLVPLSINRLPSDKPCTPTHPCTQPHPGQTGGTK